MSRVSSIVSIYNSAIHGQSMGIKAVKEVRVHKPPLFAHQRKKKDVEDGGENVGD